MGACVHGFVLPFVHLPIGVYVPHVGAFRPRASMLRASALSCGAAGVRPPGLGAGRGSVGRAMSGCPGEVLDRYPPPVWLVVIEAPDTHVDEVVRGTLSQGEELPSTDVGSPVTYDFSSCFFPKFKKSAKR